jgi:hypothetical protein
MTIRSFSGAAIVLALARVSFAQLDPNLTPPEFKCQASVNKRDGKYFRALAKCELKCQQGFAGGLNPVTDCYPPYAGAMTVCVDDPVKGANVKFRAAIAKACDPATNPSANCPECYDAAVGGAGCGDPGYAADHQALGANFFDVLVPVIHCKTAGASIAERKCQDATLSTVGKQVLGVYKCFGKCFARAYAGLIPGSDCLPNPILPNDVATQTCIGVVQTKSTLAYGKRCADAGVSIQCPVPCGTNAGCDSAPMAGDGICTDHNCVAGNTSTSPYYSASGWTNLITNAAAPNVVNSGLGPDTGTFCSQ